MKPYTPGFVPSDLSALQSFLQNELRRIAESISQIHDLDVLSNEPFRPKAGQIAYADGSSWNPGLGQGAYIFDGSTWNKIG